MSKVLGGRRVDEGEVHLGGEKEFSCDQLVESSYPDLVFYTTTTAWAIEVCGQGNSFDPVLCKEGQLHHSGIVIKAVEWVGVSNQLPAKVCIDARKRVIVIDSCCRSRGWVSHGKNPASKVKQGLEIEGVNLICDCDGGAYDLPWRSTWASSIVSFDAVGTIAVKAYTSFSMASTTAFRLVAEPVSTP
jgi:hypothetical protein